MKKIFLFITLFLIFSNSFSQSGERSYYEFSKRTSLFLENTNGVEILKIKVEADPQDANSKPFDKTINLDNGIKEAKYRFGENYVSENRNFTIISNDYVFYVFNIITHSLSPAKRVISFSPDGKETGKKFSGLKISDNKLSIFGRIDEGAGFLFSICKPEEPIQHFSLNPPFIGTDRFFEVPICKNSNFSGFLVFLNENQEVEIKEIFTEKNLIPQTSANTDFAEDDIEEMIMNMSVYDSKYAIICEKDANGSELFSVVGIIDRKMIEIPMEYRKSKDYVKKYLKDNL